MRKLALIGAMESEIRAYLTRTSRENDICEENFTFSSGEFYGKSVVITRSLTGKVLTAMTTQKVIDRFRPEAVIMIGVAGALQPDLRVGDVVVSHDCVQYDLDVTTLGYPRGAVPNTSYRFIQADSRLVSLAMKAQLESHRLIIGRIVSGDQFLSEEETYRRRYLFEELEGCVIEMEGAALAQVCAFNKTPFVIIRTVCSELDGNQEQQFRASLPNVVDNSFRVVESILEGW
jgi:adenosylhomocysteine nucleosidase